MKGEGWGIKILGNVIEINSYIAFFRMEPLAALLLREFCSQQKISHANQQEQHVARETAQTLEATVLITSRRPLDSFKFQVALVIQQG
jgi:hypothetical protein